MRSSRHSRSCRVLILVAAVSAAAVTFGQAPSTGSGQPRSTSSGQARSTSSGQAASTGSGQASRPSQRPAPAAPAPYFPERFTWQKQTPEQARLDGARIDAAVKFSVASENPGNKDLAIDLATSFGREPFDTPIGPVKSRGALSGIIIKNGYIVAEWGDTTRTDMTFSVTKSFLSTVVGLIWQKGLIRDLTDPVKDYMPAGDAAALFESPHNAKITWEHLLRQTSDWQGTLWGKPDWADRPEGQTPADWPNRKLSEPGRATSTTTRG